ncbi:toxin MIT1 [Oncorhynchus keta]|uniref:toxin MIT1 n=1 Tax=Oncorhynchus keta TaxID=8018 RepID=UPI00227A7BFB|nr:toxin MIT1 [Oncorhynchus keta]
MAQAFTTAYDRLELYTLMEQLQRLVLYYDTDYVVYACEKDSQCGGRMCCAVSLWIRSPRMCAPMGQERDDCHCLSHKVPFFGKRLHHTCPCLPNLACITTSEGKSKCLSPYMYQEYYL